MKWPSVEFNYLLDRKENNEREAWAISNCHKCYVFCPNWIFYNCFDVVYCNVLKCNILKSGWNQCCSFFKKWLVAFNLKNRLPSICILRFRTKPLKYYLMHESLFFSPLPPPSLSPSFPLSLCPGGTHKSVWLQSYHTFHHKTLRYKYTHQVAIQHFWVVNIIVSTLHWLLITFTKGGKYWHI